ncbi:MAG: AI-2E family transporter [Acidaminococcaceae bacterium]|nr:AI-2E family transporter [Acidaminococcaceae bacterium]MBO5605971.1 AI-2E family transporter [Acidaminococcaceae bacterium]MBO6265620.1 AI-2E family transporter [Acidaminococcaceae bacterium]MBP3264985.1 AI-2E family transporter [Acidaminococcaceae bacterium]MBQ5343718.1 AI-2E family transporter [Acidaminococcaceae bacterium]
MKNKYLHYVQQHTVVKFLIAFIVSAILYAMSSFLFPILLAIGLAFALYPLSRAFVRLQLGKTGMHPSRVAAIVLAFIASAIFMGIVISFVVLPLFGQINELIVKLPEYSEQMQGESLLRILKDPSAGVPMLPSNLEGLLNDAINSIMGFLTNVVRNLLNSTVQLVANLVGLIVVPFLAFYFLKDWKVLCNMITDLFTPGARPKASRVLANIGIAISSYVEGLWKLSLLSALSVTIVLLILGVPYPLVFGLIALLAETIPVIGPIISAIPAIFVAYTSTTAHTAFVLAIFYIVYYTVDSQVLQPVIMGKKIKLHPVVILLALMIGGKLFGILGMLFAMPVAAVYRVLYDELWHYDGKDMEEDLETDEVAASLTTDPTDDQLVQQRKEMAVQKKN